MEACWAATVASAVPVGNLFLACWALASPPPLFIEALGWEPGLLRAFLWPAPITSLRRLSAKLWLKLWPEGEKEKMGEGKEWVLRSSKQSYPGGAREDHLAGTAWSWDCVGLGFPQRSGKEGSQRPAPPLCTMWFLRHAPQKSAMTHIFQLGKLSVQESAQNYEHPGSHSREG